MSRFSSQDNTIDLFIPILYTFTMANYWLILMTLLPALVTALSSSSRIPDPSQDLLQGQRQMDRRHFHALLGSSVATSLLSSFPAVADEPVSSTTTTRDDLLQAIAARASDDQVISIIQGLKDPSEGKGATLSQALDGQWELIWSYKAEAFSPLLKLPKPFKPDSYQYFGPIADAEVGKGRIAQGLTGGLLLGEQHVWLSSGAIPLVDTDPSVLEIQPPFRLQLGGRAGSGKPKQTLVDSGSDADFRKVNARTKEAQEAGKNLYQQMYLENNGPGSLRVSGVIAGDPVLVGELFVHRKL